MKKISDKGVYKWRQIKKAVKKYHAQNQALGERVKKFVLINKSEIKNDKNEKK